MFKHLLFQKWAAMAIQWRVLWISWVFIIPKNPQSQKVCLISCNSGSNPWPMVRLATCLSSLLRSLQCNHGGSHAELHQSGSSKFWILLYWPYLQNCPVLWRSGLRSTPRMLGRSLGFLGRTKRVHQSSDFCAILSRRHSKVSAVWWDERLKS